MNRQFINRKAVAQHGHNLRSPVGEEVLMELCWPRTHRKAARYITKVVINRIRQAG